MKKQHVLGATALAAALAMQGGCGKKNYSDLAERPEEKTATAVPVKEESLLTLNALFPYATLTQALTTAFPAEIPIQGRQRVCVDVEVQVQKTVEDKIGGDVGKVFGAVARIVTKVITVGQTQNLCSDIDYSATIRREGDVVVTPNGAALRFSVPVRADGGAGFAGDLAKLLKLDRKNFRGALTAVVDVRMDINEDWCPSVQASPDFSWREKAQLEVAGKFWIDIDAQAGDAIRKAISEAAQKLPSLVTCDHIKQLVLPIWHEYTIPLPPFAGQTRRVTLTPQRVGFSGLNFVPTGVQLALMLTAQSEVEVIPLKPEDAASSAAPEAPKSKKASPPVTPASASVANGILPLPKLERIPAQQDKLKLAVPITVAYASLQDLTGKAVLEKTFEGSTGDTQASVKIKEVKVYPSGDKLAVGLRFESKISKPKGLAPQGWVYLVAKPSFDASTQTLRLTDVDFSRIIDNDLWNALSFLFQDRIRKEIEDAARIDLRSQVAEARATLKRELTAAATKEGINVSLKDEFLGLSRIGLTTNGVQTVVGFEVAPILLSLTDRPADISTLEPFPSTTRSENADTHSKVALASFVRLTSLFLYVVDLRGGKGYRR